MNRRSFFAALLALPAAVLAPRRFYAGGYVRRSIRWWRGERQEMTVDPNGSVTVHIDARGMDVAEVRRIWDRLNTGPRRRWPLATDHRPHGPRA